MFLSQYIGTSSHIDQWVSLGWNQNDKSLIQIFWIRERFCYFMVCCVCRNGAWTTFFRKTEPSEHVKITGFNFSTIRAMIFLGNLSLSVWQIFSLLVKLVCAVVECTDHWTFPSWRAYGLFLFVMLFQKLRQSIFPKSNLDEEKLTEMTRTKRQ